MLQPAVVIITSREVFEGIISSKNSTFKTNGASFIILFFVKDFKDIVSDLIFSCFLRKNVGNSENPIGVHSHVHIYKMSKLIVVDSLILDTSHILVEMKSDIFTTDDISICQCK